MKKIFRNVLLATSVVVSFGPIYAYAYDEKPVVLDIIYNIYNLQTVPAGQSSIVNIGVNEGEIDASVTIKGENITFEGEHAKGKSFENGVGALGNSLGGGISWANSIETSAIGANAKNGLGSFCQKFFIISTDQDFLFQCSSYYFQ